MGVSDRNAASSHPMNFPRSIPSSGVPWRVEGRFIMQQLSGLSDSNVQILFWIARRNLGGGLANALSRCIIMSMDRGKFSPEEHMSSLSGSVSCGAGFMLSRVPRLRSICWMFVDFFCFSFAGAA